MTTDSSLDPVREYYAHFDRREWHRLADTGEGAIEFAITCRALIRHLPSSGRVLDLGGGPGRYAIWLVERGYQVTLADLSSNLLEIARSEVADADVAARIESITVADARDLSAWGDESFDAVLSLGPFYHLSSLEDRRAAASEMVRVLRPQGLAFVALMPRYGLLRRTMVIPDERHHLLQTDWLRKLLDEGWFENEVPGRFNSGFGVRPEDVIPFFDQFGLESIDLLGVESLSVGIHDTLMELAKDEPDTFAKVLDLLEDAASDPGIHGLCSHLLYVGNKQEAPKWASDE